MLKTVLAYGSFTHTANFVTCCSKWTDGLFMHDLKELQRRLLR